jgi:ribonuclease inhibitor
MTTVVIDGDDITDRHMLHEMLSLKLDLPEWYGRNLDALADCLTDIHEDTAVVIKNADALKKALGSYEAAFLNVLLRASKENPHLQISRQ